MKIKIKRLTETAKLPTQATSGSAGYDLFADVTGVVVLHPGQRALIPTGFSMEIPVGYEAQVRARSGLAIKHGIGLVNGVGTIDSDYRGNLGVLLINCGNEPFCIENGDRIAQMIISKYESVQWDETDDLEQTKRGEGGFGSTGRD